MHVNEQAFYRIHSSIYIWVQQHDVFSDLRMMSFSLQVPRMLELLKNIFQQSLTIDKTEFIPSSNFMFSKGWWTW